MLIGLGADQDVIKRLLDAAEDADGRPARLLAPSSSKVLKAAEDLWRRYRQALLSAARSEAEAVRREVEGIVLGLRSLRDEATDRADDIASYIQGRLQRFVTGLIEWAMTQVPAELKLGSRSMTITGIKLVTEHKLAGNLSAALYQVATLVLEGTLKLEVSYGPLLDAGPSPPGQA